MFIGAIKVVLGIAVGLFIVKALSSTKGKKISITIFKIAGIILATLLFFFFLIVIS